MKRKLKGSIFAVLLLSLTLLVSACGDKAGSAATGDTATSAESSSSSDTKQERVLTDALGHEVKIPANPQRIIASYLEDHLVALGVKPVAQWSVSNGGTQAYLEKDLNGVPEIASELPYEAVMSFSPDLIILSSADMAADDKYEQYSKIAPTYVVGKEKNNNWREELKAVGDVLGKSKEAEQVLAAYEQKAADAKEKLSSSIGTHSAAALWVTAKSIFVVSDHLSSGAVMYNDLGLTVPKIVEEVSKTGTGNWNTLSMEKFAQLDADYLFIVNTRGVSMEDVLKDAVWKNIPAVKQGQVYEFDDKSSWLYSGTIANSQMIDDVLKNVVR